MGTIIEKGPLQKLSIFAQSTAPACFTSQSWSLCSIEPETSTRNYTASFRNFCCAFAVLLYTSLRFTWIFFFLSWYKIKTKYYSSSWNALFHYGMLCFYQGNAMLYQDFLEWDKKKKKKCYQCCFDKTVLSNIHVVTPASWQNTKQEKKKEIINLSTNSISSFTGR